MMNARTRLSVLTVTLIAFSPFVPGQDSSRVREAEVAPVVTRHQITLEGKPLRYTATTGYMVMKDEKGKARANVYFIAYTKDDVRDVSKRPVCFTFNGGPGSSSVWLHLGTVGPKRVLQTESGESLSPPYKLVDNEYTWLDRMDIVLIDPVMTGYSRPAGNEEQKQFTGYQEDIESVGDFIRLYTTRYERWSSPKFLAGESYGTTRAAGLSGYLQDRHGLYLNGIILISSVLNFQTLEFEVGNDLPYTLFLPTYTATAWYHKKLPADLQVNLQKALDEARKFAIDEYTPALMQGDGIPEAQRKHIVEQLARLTGLSQTFVEESNMRIEIGHFTKELMRDQKRTVGRLDSRFTGIDRTAAGEHTEYDPSYSTGIYGPYTAMINDYLHRELNFKSDLPYEILTVRVRPWNYSNVQNRYLNVGETLRQAMSKNPFLRVLVVCGYYDLATPFFAAEYTVNTLQLDPSLRSHITMAYYESGHMVYIHKPSLEKLKKDAMALMRSALPEE